MPTSSNEHIGDVLVPSILNKDRGLSSGVLRKNTECVGADNEDNGGRGQWRHEDLLSGEGKQEGLQRSQEFLLV